MLRPLIHRTIIVAALAGTLILQCERLAEARSWSLSVTGGAVLTTLLSSTPSDAVLIGTDVYPGEPSFGGGLLLNSNPTHPTGSWDFEWGALWLRRYYSAKYFDGSLNAEAKDYNIDQFLCVPALFRYRAASSLSVGFGLYGALALGWAHVFQGKEFDDTVQSKGVGGWEIGASLALKLHLFGPVSLDGRYNRSLLLPHTGGFTLTYSEFLAFLTIRTGLTWR